MSFEKVSRRALHFVFKIGNRPLTIKFFKEILGMTILRHEEFEEGCEAACNGPYDGKWSKTMIGYGPEDSHFVMELTYNYGVSKYNMGNDFLGVHLQSSEAIENAKRHNWTSTVENDLHVLEAPGGYKFYIKNQPQPKDKDPIIKVQLACEDLERSLEYWRGLCEMSVYSQSFNSCELGYSDEQCKLEFVCINKPVDHAKAFGRIAYSCPSSELAGLEKVMKENNNKILTPLISLDTPGKATVQVVILADPDGHEVCFVGDEAFRQLSLIDPTADALLQKAIGADKSDEWFARKGLSKTEV